MDARESTPMSERHRTHDPQELDEGGGSPEKAAARAWLQAHAHDPEVAGASLPDDHYRDRNTGETVEDEQSAWMTLGRRSGGFDGPRSTEGHRGILPLMPDVEDRVGHGPRTHRELDVRVRLERAMARLRPDQQDLLRMKHFEGMSIEEMSAELGRVKSSVFEKLTNAQQDLYVAIAETWSLPYDPAEEHLGLRAREGRPARDREGERRAAELVFVATQTGDDDD